MCLPCVTTNCKVCDSVNIISTSSSNNAYQCIQCVSGYFLIA